MFLEVSQAGDEFSLGMIFLIAISAGVLEFIVSFFFNYKIFWIAKERFLLAGLYGAIATFIYTLMSGFIVYLSAVNSNIYILIVSAFIIALGNFSSTLVIKWWQGSKFNKNGKNGKNKKIIGEDNVIEVEDNNELFLKQKDKESENKTET